MEVDCLRLAGGKCNVLPLLFVHRCLGDVVLAMPYVEASKFSDVIKTMDFVELKLYMKNLLEALAHIHSLGIIHRHLKHYDVTHRVVQNPPPSVSHKCPF